MDIDLPGLTCITAYACLKQNQNQNKILNGN
jgi:hypothetical protein